jgi:hypothetical protein
MTMTFERTRNAELVAHLIRSAWDRPEMLSEGASIERIPALSDAAQYFVVRDDGRAIALFVGHQVSPICIELHVCMPVWCRGREATTAADAFLAWLPAATPYRKAMGNIPAYNRPMLYMARASGFRVLAINEKATMRNGQLEDLIIVERRLA